MPLIWRPQLALVGSPLVEVLPLLSFHLLPACDLHASRPCVPPRQRLWCDQQEVVDSKRLESSRQGVAVVVRVLVKHWVGVGWGLHLVPWLCSVSAISNSFSFI